MTTEEPTPGATAAGNDSEALDQARSRRVELGDAADEIEDLIARPASDPRWTARVSAAMDRLLEAFDAHVTEVESDDGLLPQLTADVPRVVNGVKRMYAEHVEIRRVLNNVMELVRRCDDDCDETAVEMTRLATVELLRMISRHRQAGADLVYEAYSVDIGGG